MTVSRLQCILHNRVIFMYLHLFVWLTDYYLLFTVNLSSWTTVWKKKPSMRKKKVFNYLKYSTNLIYWWPYWNQFFADDVIFGLSTCSKMFKVNIWLPFSYHPLHMKNRDLQLVSFTPLRCLTVEIKEINDLILVLLLDLFSSRFLIIEWTKQRHHFSIFFAHFYSRINHRSGNLLDIFLKRKLTDRILRFLLLLPTIEIFFIV